MKKLVIIIIIVSVSLNSFSQQRKVVSAYTYLKDFNENKDVESLKKAKEAIDEASLDVDTKESPKTLNYRGLIYLTIFDNNLRLETEKLNSISDPNKRIITGYQKVEIFDLDEAYTSYSKANTLDTKENFKAEISSGIARIASHYANKAISEYNGKNYVKSLPLFEKVNEIKAGKDSSSLGNCALLAEKTGNYEKAKIYYQQMIDNKIGRSSAYSSLVNVYFMLKDTLGGLTVLTKGRNAFPNDIALIISETNQFLRLNKSKEAIENLNLAVKSKPADYTLYLVRGNAYDNLANPKDAAGKELPKPKEFDDLILNAELDYKKALDLKPEYFDALYNLGVLYNNRGVSISKVIDKITDNAIYNRENKKATEEFNRAMPILEKALEVNSKDRATMLALKQIYSRLQLTEKLKNINDRLSVN